jgi:hypothetical protein
MAPAQNVLMMEIARVIHIIVVQKKILFQETIIVAAIIAHIQIQ